MAELALGILGVAGTIDVCLKWGGALIDSCKAYKDADDDLREISVRIQVCWVRVSNQLSITRELESTLSEEDKDLQEQILCILQGKLGVATRKISKLIRSSSLSVIDRLKYVLLKDAIKETIAELELWQKLYEPTWFQIIKFAPPNVEVTLKKIDGSALSTGGTQLQTVARTFRDVFNDNSGPPIRGFIPEADLKPCRMQEIPFCKATLARRQGNVKHPNLIVDPIGTGKVKTEDAREFARRLKGADPFTFGLLSCVGILKHSTGSDLSFVFNVPADYTVVWSLRQLLLSGQIHDTLSHRLEIARHMVTAVYYVHLYGFVHKRIRPDTILCMGKEEEGSQLPRTAFLVGFQVIRNADGTTYPMVDKSWESNIYKHPLVQGTDSAYYLMQHDIYSLGVCLLEIGLWHSFVTYGPYWTPLPSSGLGLPLTGEVLGNPFDLKDHLVSMSRSSALKRQMGSKYSQVVETCLTCLDEGNIYFLDQAHDEEENTISNSGMIGVRYIQQVLRIFDSISI